MGRIDIGDTNIATATGLYRSPHAREHRQFILRLAIAPAVWVFAGAALWWLHAAIPMHFFLASIVYLAVGAGLYAASRRAQTPSFARQAAAVALDVGGLAYLAVYTQGFAALPWLLYPAVLIDTGMRFGRRVLNAGTALAVIALICVAWLSPYWADRWLVLTSIVAAVVAVPRFVLRTHAARNTEIARALHEQAVAADAVARVRDVIRAAFDIIGINTERLATKSRLGKRQPQIVAMQAHIAAAAAYLQDDPAASSPIPTGKPRRWRKRDADNAAPTSDQDATARVLLVTDNAASLHVIGKLLAAKPVQVTTARTFTTAATLFARAIRKGEPVHIVLVDANASFGVRDPALAARWFADMLDKAAAITTPVYLLGAADPANPLLRADRYAGVVSASACDRVADMARASPVWARRQHQSVVRVEPWAWQQHGLASAQRILVVDDTKTNLLVVQSILDAAGYDVDVMTHAIPALERLTAGDYSLAIIDMHMPDMDGIALLKRYQLAAGARRRIPIVFLTADTRPDATRECAEAGADAFLNKPVRPDNLLGTVEVLLEAEALRQQSPTAVADDDGDEAPAIDLERIQELARIFGGTESIVGNFCGEAEALVAQLAGAAEAHNYQAFCDAANALRASAADVGAAALAVACHDAGAIEVSAFTRDGVAMSIQIRALYEASVRALTAALQPDSWQDR